MSETTAETTKPTTKTRKSHPNSEGPNGVYGAVREHLQDVAVKAVSEIRPMAKPTPQEMFDFKFSNGIRVARVALKNPFEVPLVGADSALYSHKGYQLAFVPGDGVYIKVKDACHFVPVGNIIGWSLNEREKK